MKRVKLIPKEEFDSIAQLSWAPIRLEGNSIPGFLRGIPGAALHSIYGSGTTPGGGAAYSDASIGTGQLIGGMEVYRYATGDPVELNKDCYLVVLPPQDSPYYMITGPFKDSEHWIDDIPRRLEGARVFGLPDKKDADRDTDEPPLS